jgi:hypothetical protein
MAISSMINLMFTSFKADTNQVLDRTVDLQDVKRLLELGKILISILTKEELKILEETIMSGPSQVSSTPQNREPWRFLTPNPLPFTIYKTFWER